METVPCVLSVEFYCWCLTSLLPRWGTGKQQPDWSQIRCCLIWEGQNPNLDMECATEISAFKRYGQILVASCNMAVMPLLAKGCPGTEVWDCVLTPGLSGPVQHSEEKRRNSILGEHFKISFFPDSVPLKVLWGWKQQTVPLKISSSVKWVPTKRHLCTKQ